jgi:hypothetical protein
VADSAHRSFYRLWQANQAVTLLTVGGLGYALVVVAATMLVPQVVALVRLRQTIRGRGLKSVVGVVLALAFKLHLLVFDPIFLRRGSMKRLLKQRS